MRPPLLPRSPGAVGRCWGRVRDTTRRRRSAQRALWLHGMWKAALGRFTARSALAVSWYSAASCGIRERTLRRPWWAWAPSRARVGACGYRRTWPGSKFQHDCCGCTCCRRRNVGALTANAIVAVYQPLGSGEAVAQAAVNPLTVALRVAPRVKAGVATIADLAEGRDARTLAGPYAAVRVPGGVVSVEWMTWHHRARREVRWGFSASY